MVFGTWYCPTCKKTIQVGTVAPRSVMWKHCATIRHKKLEAERDAAEAAEQAQKQNQHAENHA